MARSTGALPDGASFQVIPSVGGDAGCRGTSRVRRLTPRSLATWLCESIDPLLPRTESVTPGLFGSALKAGVGKMQPPEGGRFTNDPARIDVVTESVTWCVCYLQTHYVVVMSRADWE